MLLAAFATASGLLAASSVLSSCFAAVSKTSFSTRRQVAAHFSESRTRSYSCPSNHSRLGPGDCGAACLALAAGAVRHGLLLSPEGLEEGGGAEALGVALAAAEALGCSEDSELLGLY